MILIILAMILVATNCQQKTQGKRSRYDWFMKAVCVLWRFFKGFILSLDFKFSTFLD